MLDLINEINNKINIDSQFSYQSERISELSFHKNYGNGDNNSLNLKRILNLIFGSEKNHMGQTNPLLLPGSWKRYSDTKKQNLLPGHILYFYTHENYDGDFRVPFSQVYITKLKKGRETLSNEPVILILSHYLASTISSNVCSSHNAEILLNSVKYIIEAENDKTGLSILQSKLSSIDGKVIQEDQLYSFMYDFFVIACLRRNTPSENQDVNHDVYDCFLASIFNHAASDCISIDQFKNKYIPIYLTQKQYSHVTESDSNQQTPLLTLCSVLENYGRAIIVGANGSGKTTLLKAFAVYYHDLSKNNPLVWYSNENNQEMKHKYNSIMWINGHDIRDNFHNNFQHYINDQAIIFNDRNADNDKYSACHKLIIIDGLDDIFSVCPNNSRVSPRNLFLCSLNNYLKDNPNVDVVITATEITIKNCQSTLIDFLPETDTFLYSINPPNEKEMRAYCKKKQINHDLQEKILQIINNNQAIREIISTHLMLSYFIDITERDGGIIPIRSQLQLLRDIVDINMIHSADISSNQKPINEYDIKSVLALLALINSEHSINNNQVISSMPIYTDQTVSTYSIEAFLTDPRIMALDLYLTDNSCLRPLGESSQMKTQAQNLVQLLKNSNTPFVKIIQDEKSQASSFAFSSQIWQNYFSSYALANGIGINIELNDKHYQLLSSFDMSMKYVHDRIYQLCFENNYQNEEVINSWIQIIADAAILSRQNAYKYLQVLSEFAANASPNHRKAREFATLTILKILRNSPFLSTSDWKKYSDMALSYYFYHNQLEDFDAILRFSSRKKTFCLNLFDAFKKDVYNMCSIPRFVFCVGYICYRWIPSKKLSENLSPGELTDIAINNIENHLDHINSINDFVDLANSYYDKWINNKLDNTAMPSFIMSVMAICSHYWLNSTKTLMTEITNRLKKNLELKISPKVNRCLIQLIGNSDWRIKNIAGFALTHVISYALDNSENNEFTILDANKTSDAKYSRLYEIIMADYDARTHAEHAVSGDKTPFCGALRLMTVIHITADDYGMVGKFSAGAQITYYQKIWEDYLKNIREKIEDGGNSQRYLMLFFRICFLLGIWNDKITISDSENPIVILFKIKKQNAHKNIGLRYDREDMLFDDLKKIANHWNLEIDG